MRWLLFLLAVPGSDDRFIHFLAGVPVGEIQLIREGNQYTYVSRHFFRAGAKAVERFSPSGRDNPVWASESLLKVSAEGCWNAQDELTLHRGQVCVTQAGPTAKGTLLGQPFTARYHRGALQELEVGDSRFSRNAAPVAFADPFGEGVAVMGSGDALALNPPLKGARRARPTPTGGSEDCLGAANAYLKEHPEFELVLGLLDDGKRGWAHAWVKHRTTGEELDPSRPPTTAGAPRYLGLPSGEAARVYLDLLTSRRTLRRVP